jgi:hypothetical protein
MNDMKKRLVDAIKGCNELCRECDRKGCEGCFLLSEYDKEADALLLAGILVPPVKLGDTVYAAVDLDDAPAVDEYVVAGFEYLDGEWYVQQEGYKDCFKVGSDLCLLTREEAEVIVQAKEKRWFDGDQ